MIDAPKTVRVPVAKLKLTSEDDPRKRPTFAGVRQSVAAEGGNLVPIFITKNAEVIDGNTRVCALIDEGIAEAVCMVFPEDWTEEQVLRASISIDGVRRKLPITELGAKAQRLIDLKGYTQAHAADETGISPSHLSRALASLTLPEKHQEAAAKLKGSVRAKIAAIKDSALMDAAMEFATTPGPDGKLPTREALEYWLKRRTGETKRGRKPRNLKGKFQGRSYYIERREGEPVVKLAEWLKSFAKWLVAGDDDSFEFSA